MRGRSEEPRSEQGGEGEERPATRVSRFSEPAKATNAPSPSEAPITAEPPLCKCGRGPWRKGQRNCLACNREANAKYRVSLKKSASGAVRGSP